MVAPAVGGAVLSSRFTTSGKRLRAHRGVREHSKASRARGGADGHGDGGVGGGAVAEGDDVGAEGVSIRVAKARGEVGHVAGVVPDGEAAARGHKMRVRRVERRHILRKLLVEPLAAALRVHRLARVIQDRQYSRRALLRLDELAHDLVVEERDRRPCDALLLVLLLQDANAVGASPRPTNRHRAQC